MAETVIDERDNQWVCRCCGHKGDFLLLGKGFIRCSMCGSGHFVSLDGELFLITLGETNQGGNQ